MPVFNFFVVLCLLGDRRKCVSRMNYSAEKMNFAVKRSSLGSSSVSFRGIDKKICTYRSACLSFVCFLYTCNSFSYSVNSLQSNLDILKGQGTGNFHLLLPGFITSGFVYMFFTITGAKNIVC